MIPLLLFMKTIQKSYNKILEIIKEFIDDIISGPKKKAYAYVPNRRVR